MILSLFIFFTGFSGVLLSYMLGNKRLNRMIPVTFMSIVTILYIFGLMDHLKIGAIFVDIMILVVYLSFAIWFFIHRNQSWIHIKALFPCFAVWGVIFVIINYCDIGMMAHNWDEFSHWADTAKIMTYLDDFATGSNSPSLYKSYPPAMSLLQYFFQRNKMWFKGDDLFTDWRLYLTYHVFAVSMLFPCFDCKEMTYKKIIKALALILVSVLFYVDLPESLYIDPFVAILGGYAILSTVMDEEKDKISLISISLACICLTLAKDIGMYFALVAGIIYLLQVGDYSIKKLFSVKRLYGIIPLVFMLLAKLTWKYELSKYDLATKKGMHIDLGEYFNMLFLKNGVDYKQEVVNKAIHAFFENRVDFGVFCTSYFWIFVFCMALIIISCYRFCKQDKYDRKKSVFICVALFLMVILYYLFIGAIYAYGFSEYEATGLASYERYMNMPFLILVLVAVCMLLDSIGRIFKDSNILACIAIVVGLIFGLNGSINKYMSRTDAENSKSFENSYRNIRPAIWYYCKPDDRIYFVSIADMGIDHLAAAYYVRPYSFLNLSWSVGGPYFEGDIWSDNISPEEWMDMLVESCDYVYIHKTKEEFIDEFGVCFADPSAVENDTLYEVDCDNRVLIRVD